MLLGRFTWVVPALAGALAACSGPSAKGPPPHPSFGAPDVPWKQKTHEERRAYMAAYVVPKMRRVFQEHDAKQYANFGCDTCHAKDMELVDYRMPNGLYGLPADDPVAEAKDLDEDTADFMVTKVVPAMAELLKLPISVEAPAGGEEKAADEGDGDEKAGGGEADEDEKADGEGDKPADEKSGKGKKEIAAEKVDLDEESKPAAAALGEGTAGGQHHGPGGVTCFTCHEKE
jgi:hypothetical protein